MDTYVLVLAGAGLCMMALAWLPLMLRPLPIICVAFGALLFGLLHEGGTLHPLNYPRWTERLSELVVIISLMGAGLKVERPLRWRGWGITARLLAVAMPLSIAGLAFLGSTVLALAPAAAVLLGAALAPADSVLASDVQIGPPGSGEGDEVRFSLTDEAGLNDGLAFPFVLLAIAVKEAGPAPGVWLVDWFGLAVVWKIAAGTAVGVAIGWLLGLVLFRLPDRMRLARSGDGFVSVGMTLLSYSVTELVHGYGFLAVFITALMLRVIERRHAYHGRLHDFAEQIERLLMLLLLVLFGGALASGMLAPLTWEAVAVALVFLLVVRPLSGMIALTGTAPPLHEKLAISFFGIRGIGSFYYVAYALNRSPIQDAPVLWSTAGFIVLLSIVMHGVLVTPAMTVLDRRRRALAKARFYPRGISGE